MKKPILQWISFGAIAATLYFLNRKKAALTGAQNPNNLSFSIDGEKLIDTATNFIPTNENKKMMLNLAAKEILNGWRSIK